MMAGSRDAAPLAENRFMAAHRILEPEWMDQPDLPPPLHRQALGGLARINRWSRSASILWKPIRQLARRHGLRSLSLLDLGSGAGDVTLELWRLARRAGIELRATGCDKSPLAVEQATERALEAGAAEVDFQCLDVLAEPLPGPRDIVVCSLFLHHQTDQQAEQLLANMAGAAQSLVLVNDLLRSRLGYRLAKVATHLLSRSPVVHVDGPRSVAAAFTLEEARLLAERAGLHGCTVSRRWPCRFLLAWSKPR